MTEKKKVYKFVEPAVTRQEFSQTLVKGLGRALTEQEAKTLHWLSECEFETRGVILDLFKELVKRQDEAIEEFLYETPFGFYLSDEEGELDQVEAGSLEEALEYFVDNHKGEGEFVIEWENHKLKVIL